jgi:hypothetical protein
MGGKASTAVEPVRSSTEIRVALSTIYAKQSLFDLPTDTPFPNNVFIRQRISEAEWKDFSTSLRNSLYKAEPPDILMCVVIIALAVLAFFMALGYIILIVVTVFLGWYHSYRRRSWINALYSGLAIYNKYLFRPRGLQLRLQIKCECRPLSTSSVNAADMFIKIDIAQPATRASVLSQFDDLRMESKGALRTKSAATDGYIDFYEKKENSGILCIPPVNALLDESKVAPFLHTLHTNTRPTIFASKIFIIVIILSHYRSMTMSFEENTHQQRLPEEDHTQLFQ